MAVQKVLLLLVVLTSSATNLAISQRKCSDSCGSIQIPYPFGVSPGCYYDNLFKLICNTSFDPPKLQFPDSDVSVVDISLERSEIRIETLAARDCYNEQGDLTNDSSTSSYTITHSMFPLSTRNKFIAVGCDTVGVIGGDRGRWYATGCVSRCNKTYDVVNGSCAGIGCCQMDIPFGILDFATFSTTLGGSSNHTKVHQFNPCGFAFVAEQGSYLFSELDLIDLRSRRTFPVVLDWAIVGNNLTCDQAMANNVTGFACTASNSECLNATKGPGYLCKCLKGFQGNPYLTHGCQDIDECKTKNINPCEMECNNLEGGYECICPKGFEGDGMRNGTGCTQIDHRRNNKFVIPLSIVLGVFAISLIVLIGGSWFHWGSKKRKLIKLKQKFFEENGGLLLHQQFFSHYHPGSGAIGTSSSSETTGRIFTVDELKIATNNFDQTRVVGQGGYGTVYKGILRDSRVVAIKKSRICDQSQIQQFINEVVILSQVNHRNVVKLLGCCLETQVPLLVYEFITNGTLSDHVHNKSSSSSSERMSWQMRLRILTETASAISYLHSSASIPIIHRDIKTANILLDDNFTAKVSDFGASRLVPIDQTKMTTLVQGTLGYLDPEYFHTSQLTEKSDVYSFGVVLAELLTGQKALSLDRPERDRNLALYFITSMENGELVQILDQNVVNSEGDNIDMVVVKSVEEVADIARRCLRVRGEERPSMKEVASELERILLNNKEGIIHPWESDGLTPEDANYLLQSSGVHCTDDYSKSNAGLESIMLESYHQGR